jgi:hypothetical protein
MPFQVEESHSFVLGLGLRLHSGRLGFFPKLSGTLQIHAGEWETAEET